MKNIQNAFTTELSENEMKEINGGIFVELLIAGIMFGYMVGNEAAERDRRLHSQH